MAKRIQKEYKDLLRETPLNISAAPKTGDIYNWEGCIMGPTGTVYEGGVFMLSIYFPTDYPFKPPTLKFSTRILHPNVSDNGKICLDILKNQWSPALTIGKVLLSLCSLLSEPNFADPLNVKVANMYNKNKPKFVKLAKDYTMKYAM